MKDVNDQPPVIAALGEIHWELLPEGNRLGGAPAKFAQHVSSLDADVWLVSAVGSDNLGTEALNRLKRSCLHLNHVSVLEDYPTGSLRNTLNAQGQADYRFGEDEAWDHLAKSKELDDLAKRCDAVCFGILGQRHQDSRDVINRFLTQASEKCFRVLDLNLQSTVIDSTVVETSLGFANVLKLNEMDLEYLTNSLKLSRNYALTELAERFDLHTIALMQEVGDAEVLMRDVDDAIVEDRRTAPMITTRHKLAFKTNDTSDAFTAALVMGLVYNPSDTLWKHRSAFRMKLVEFLVRLKSQSTDRGSSATPEKTIAMAHLPAGQRSLHAQLSRTIAEHTLREAEALSEYLEDLPPITNASPSHVEPAIHRKENIKTQRPKILLRKRLTSAEAEMLYQQIVDPAAAKLSRGRDLRRLREGLGLCQTEAARRLGISRQTIIRYETNVTQIPSHRLQQYRKLIDQTYPKSPKLKSLPTATEVPQQVVLDRIAASSKTFLINGATSFQSNYDHYSRVRFIEILKKDKAIELNFVFPDLDSYQADTKVAKNSFAEFKRYVFEQHEPLASQVKGWAITDFDQAFRLGLSANCVNQILVEYDPKLRDDEHGPGDDRLADIFLEINYCNGKIALLEISGVVRESMHKAIKRVLREVDSEFLDSREATITFCESLPTTLPEYQFPEMK